MARDKIRNGSSRKRLKVLVDFESESITPIINWLEKNSKEYKIIKLEK